MKVGQTAKSILLAPCVMTLCMFSCRFALTTTQGLLLADNPLLYVTVGQGGRGGARERKVTKIPGCSKELNPSESCGRHGGQTLLSFQRIKVEVKVILNSLFPLFTFIPMTAKWG